jgi:tripartite-type tricarboxylate transporter receptor subunit TctC
MFGFTSTRRRTLARGLALAASALASTWTHAGAWPERPVRLIVPFAPGGVSDAAARLVARDLAKALGQSVVVDNKAGAQGVVGSLLAKQAAPDGYTLVLMSSSVACVNPYLRKDFPFSAQRDFAPVGMIGSAPLMMLVSPKLGVRTLDEFLAYAKSNTGKVNYATPGIGGSAHLYSEVFNVQRGLGMLQVPYQGGAPAIQALLSGEAAMTMADMSFVESQVNSGRLVALAVAGDRRWPRLPQVPTFAERGHPINLVGWVGLMAPAGTPATVLDKLNSELRKITAEPAHQDTLLRLGVLAGTSSTADMTRALEQGCPPWGEAVRQAGIQPE